MPTPTTTHMRGTGKVASADFKVVKWTGKTKAGNACVITLKNALNMGNLDWTFAEKDDTVSTITFTACYDNTDDMVSDDTDLIEPWEIELTSSDTSEAGNILLGAGVVSIGGTDVALTRGGSHFTVEREFREINADGDRGPVKGRVVIDAARATLELNALQFLTNMTTLFAATETFTPGTSGETH